MKAFLVPLLALMACLPLHAQDSNLNFTISFRVERITDAGLIGVRKMYIAASGPVPKDALPSDMNSFLLIGYPRQADLADGDIIGVVIARDGVYKDGGSTIRKYRFLKERKL